MIQVFRRIEFPTYTVRKILMAMVFRKLMPWLVSWCTTWAKISRCRVDLKKRHLWYCSYNLWPSAIVADAGGSWRPKVSGGAYISHSLLWYNITVRINEKLWIEQSYSLQFRTLRTLNSAFHLWYQVEIGCGNNCHWSWVGKCGSGCIE